MTVRNVKKNLAAQQDMLPGVGPYQQVRRGVTVTVDGPAKSYIELWKEYCGEAYVGTFEDGFVTKPGCAAVSLAMGKAYRYTATAVVVMPANSPIDSNWVELSTSVPGKLEREALRRSYAEAGYNLVDGSFELGGTVTTVTDVLLYEADGKAYSFSGTLPHTVDGDSAPGDEPGMWTDRSSAPNSFKQSGTGSVHRTSQDKMRERVTPQDFGAVGDGLADDTIAVQNALNKKGLVFFLAGRYKVTSPLRVYGNTHILGDGNAVIDWANPSADWTSSFLFVNGPVNGTAPAGGYDNTKNIKISGLTIDGTTRANLGYMVSFIAFAHHENIAIENNIFINYAGNTHAIELNSTKNALVSNNQFKGFMQNGASLGSREIINIDSSTTNGFPTFGPWDGTVCENILIINNEFDGGDSAVGSHNASLVNTIQHQNINVISNTIKNCISRGVSAWHWKNSTIRDNYVHLGTAGGRGIFMAAAKNCIIDGNTIENATSIGVQLGYNDANSLTDNVVISNNTLINCGGSPLEGCKNVHVTNNNYVDVNVVGTNVWSMPNTAEVYFDGNTFPEGTVMDNKNPYGGQSYSGTVTRYVNGTLISSSTKDTVSRIPIHTCNRQGLVWICTHTSETNSRPRGLYYYRATFYSGDSLILQPVVEGATNINLTTGELTGTTGPGNTFTISVVRGHLLIENRLGTVMFSVQFI